jgi:sugar phosphate isomerase/epimerase
LDADVERRSAQFLPKAQQCGFDIHEINAPKVARMSDAERATLKAAADESGLKLTYSIGMTADLDVSSEDPATRKKRHRLFAGLVARHEAAGRRHHGRDQLRCLAGEAFAGIGQVRAHGSGGGKCA